MNISFTKLGHEECEICEAFDVHDNKHSKDSLSSECETCQSWIIHKGNAKKSREIYTLHVEQSCKSVDTVYYSSDLQKVIMLPKMNELKKLCSFRIVKTSL